MAEVPRGPLRSPSVIMSSSVFILNKSFHSFIPFSEIILCFSEGRMNSNCLWSHFPFSALPCVQIKAALFVPSHVKLPVSGIVHFFGCVVFALRPVFIFFFCTVFYMFTYKASCGSSVRACCLLNFSRQSLSKVGDAAGCLLHYASLLPNVLFQTLECKTRCFLKI